MLNYIQNPTPGLFEHRSGDCRIHGTNVAHARAFGGSGPHYCVECMLVAAKQLAITKAHAAIVATSQLGAWLQESA